jgi:transposase-like protein
MNVFKYRQFTAEIILWAVRWYLKYGISYRELESMLKDRGVKVDHTTIYRWVMKYTHEIKKRTKWYKGLSSYQSIYVDETYIKVKGKWKYLYRAINKSGQTIDFLLIAYKKH